MFLMGGRMKGAWRGGRMLRLGEGAASPPLPLPAGTREKDGGSWGGEGGLRRAPPPRPRSRPWGPARCPAGLAVPPHLGSGRASFLLARAAGELRLFSMAMR